MPACFSVSWVMSPRMGRMWMPPFLLLPSELEVCVYACAINIPNLAILIWYLPFFVNNPFHPFCTVLWYWCTGICDLYRKDRPNFSCILRDSFSHHHEAKSTNGFVRNTSMDQVGGRELGALWWLWWKDLILKKGYSRSRVIMYNVKKKNTTPRLVT